MMDTPFTVSADLDLGTRVGSYLRSDNADVTISEGEVPQTLEDVTDRGVSFEVNATDFLLHLPAGASFHVSGGKHISYARNGASDRDVALFLLGSAWGALCYQRGLLPLHASAVMHEGKVHAFTGQSGAGKSTLAAGLSVAGLDFFTDDVLIIDPADIRGSTARCFAGQKDMKLWEDALQLTGVESSGRVRDQPDFNKHFALPATTEEKGSGDLVSLTILKNENVRRDRDPIEIEKVRGAQALKHLRESIYRMRFGSAIMGRQKLFTALGQLIAAVHVQTFDRSMLKPQFENSSAAMRDWIKGYGKTDG
ncbi:hypothetical protein [Aurantiacibacter marinus]|uniref:HPr kinase/phosphorylase C-terminal domain-containing protein n=1 Tax=Aurantiacibacter marinus TaxID=874156 RepID=A0A0H0XN39_9SPHN|nr:hypothetical protein [Aurantiacibacter marinus]KLI63327.1 hypothetical protein AAV99_11760 [Aurantiacibacter marinus]